MIPDRDDPLLDACLDEVLGGRTPPDLTARIMQALAARGGANGANGQVHPVPVPPPVLAGVPLAAVSSAAHAAASNGHAAAHVNSRGPAVRLRRRRTSDGWLLAAAVVGGGVAVSLISYVVSNRPEIAKNPAPPANPGAIVQASPPPNKSSPVEVRPVAPARPVPEIPLVVERTPKVPDRRPAAPNPRPTPEVANVVSSNARPAVAPVTPLPKRYLQPSPDAEVVSFVNSEISRHITEAGVKTAPAATDAEWCRRLFVRVLGRIPTIEELDQFTADKTKARREKLVQKLLTDEQYVAQYAEHWATIWSNVLIGRTGGTGSSLASREGLQQYLRTALAKNEPYDEMVRELLTATGSADDHPAVNFLLDGLDKDATLATARVSRVFLGQQLACAQCHHHPTQEWSQDQFWALNSFLRQMQGQKSAGIGQLVNANFAGQGRGAPDGEVYFETPDGRLKSAFPKFLDGTEIPPSGNLADVDRRGELAKFVVASNQLPKALVNRLWSHFFGYGFTRPVDDLGNPPSHPELLDRLATEFAAHNYDLRSVIRWVALSDAFARSSKLTDIATKDMPEAGEVALFSRYYSRPMQAEEVYNSLVQAAQIRRTAANQAALEKARVDWLAQFSRNMGTDDAEEEHHAGGVRQSLIMMNGDLMKQAVNSQQAGALKNVAASNMRFEQKVQHLFRSAFSREPTRREQDAAAAILRNSKGNEQTALEDIWWAILNSNEFILDH